MSQPPARAAAITARILVAVMTKRASARGCLTISIHRGGIPFPWETRGGFLPNMIVASRRVEKRISQHRRCGVVTLPERRP